MCEELWEALGGKESIAKQPWPEWDESALAVSSIEIPVQINGKVKAKISVAPDASNDEVLEIALADEKVKAQIEGKTVVKKIVVPGRLVNLVVK